MADDNPSSSNPPVPSQPAPLVPKKETVRITLPTKPGESPAVKRETVRLSTLPPTTAPKAPVEIVADPADDALKGQTIRITPVSSLPKTAPDAPVAQPPAAKPMPGAPPPSTPALPSFSKPAMPPPSAPKLPGMPGSLPGARPPGAPPPAPPAPLGAKPPGAPAAPVSTIAPKAPAGAALASGAAKPLAAPKKETARIQTAPEARPVLPKATARMQQTQPLVSAPAPAIKSEAKISVASESDDSGEGSDTMVTILSVVAFLAAAAAAALSYFAYSQLLG
jgi:hypothetical protein